MALTSAERAKVIFILNPLEVDDFENRDAPPDFGKIADRTGLDVASLEKLWTDEAAFSSFRLDPNTTTLAQFERMPDLESDALAKVENARPFFALAELEAAIGADIDDLRSLFADPAFELPGTHLADQALEPAFDSGFIITGETLPPFQMFEALGFRVEERPGRPLRAMIYQDNGYDPAALNSAKALAGGRLFPAMRDAQGFVRYYVPGWLDVWFDAGTDRAGAEVILARHNLLLNSWNGAANIAQARLSLSPDNRNVVGAMLDAARQLREEPDVDLAEPKQFAHDDDTDFDDVQQDFLSFASGDPYWHRTMINQDKAHLVTQGDPNVTVFVIDSGIDMDHPDLVGPLFTEWRDHDLDFGCGPDATVPDARGIDHGTGVSSLAVGRAPLHSAGVLGVAPQTRFVPIRIEGRNCDYINRAIAIRKAIELTPAQGRGVINLSWQTEGSHEGVYLALQKAAEAGLAIVTSAGNYRSFDNRQANKPHYPSGYGFPAPLTPSGQPMFATIPAVCSVGAVSANGGRSSYSYFGNNAVTLAAPGGEGGGPGRSLWVAMANTAYGFGQGTSFAAPLVTGALALIFSQDPQITATDAIALLKQTAKPLGAEAELGAGILDIKAALDRIGAAPAPDPVVMPDAPADNDPVVLPDPPDTPPDNGRAGTNINLASVAEIATLPMLGQFTANQIVSHRDTAGPFTSLTAFRTWLGADMWVWSRLSKHIHV